MLDLGWGGFSGVDFYLNVRLDLGCVFWSYLSKIGRGWSVLVARMGEWFEFLFVLFESYIKDLAGFLVGLCRRQ